MPKPLRATKVTAFLRKVQAARKPLTPKQLSAELGKVIERQKESLAAYGKDSNPQIVAMRHKTQAVLDFAEAVIKAVNGNTVDLKTFQ